MLDFHLKHNGLGTILVSKVDKPELYGVVVHNQETKKISEFKEKPKEFVGNHINAGITMLDLRLLQYLKIENISIGFYLNFLKIRTSDLSCFVPKRLFILLLFGRTVERFGTSSHFYSRIKGFSRIYQ